MKNIKILKTLFLGSFLLIFIFAESKAQNIFTGNVLLQSQSQVVAFGANNYTDITGNLGIGLTPSSDVTDLTPLSTLTSVSGELVIMSNPLLSNLDGLNNITTLGGDLILEENNVLNNIDALSTLTSVNSILMRRNKQITNLDCFSNITSLELIDLFFNEKLSNIGGLSNITSASGIRVYSIPITNLNTFRNITSLDQYLQIVGTLMNNLDGLDGLTSIGDGGLYIANNTLLTSLDRLSGLTTIGGGLGISYNPLLTNLYGLNNLTSVGKPLPKNGGMQIAYNNMLTEFCGLFTLLNGGGLVGEGFAISNVPAQLYNVSGNLANPTEEEIIAGGACTTVAVKENFSLPTDFELNQNYPNPFNPTTTIEYTIPDVASDFSLRNVELNIYDVLGKRVATLVNEAQSAGNYSVQFDASNLSSGIYYYQLKTDIFWETKKMLLMK